VATRLNQRALSIELEGLSNGGQKLLANYVPSNPRTNKINIKSRYFSFVKVTCGHTLMTNGYGPDRFTESRCR
jgi:hypothetical protein